MRRGPSAESRRAWSEALEAYDRACTAGADEALERRAIPLFRLERALEAAESLDAFLAAHPMSSLEPAVRRRITANLRAIERAVATVVVTTSPAEAQVFVDDALRGQGPTARVRVAPETSVELEVRAEGYTTHRVVSTFSRGEDHVLAVQLVPLASAASSTSVASAGVEPQPTPTLAMVPADGPRPASPERPSGLAIGSAVAGVVTLLTGLTGTLLYLDSQAVTEIFYGDPDLDLALSVTLYVLSGLALVTTFSLLVAYLSSSTGPPSVGASSARREPASWACAPGLLGGSCVGRF